jgi:hypothetical protein
MRRFRPALRTDANGLATAEQIPLPANEATRVTFVRKTSRHPS